jgi:hypothetical protein
MNQQLRMILVEGVPFTGKSTTSEYIASQLDLNGYATHWISEGMLLQRHFPQTMAMLDQQELVAEATIRTEWQAFVATALADPRVFVVDSALSYVAIDPFLMADRPLDIIQAELRHIAELCAPLHPRVIHLTGDVAHLVPASIVERGPGWEEHLVRQAEAAPYQQARGRSGVTGATSMLHDSQELTRAILAQDGWPTLTLDVTAADWAAHRRAILDFLGLTEVTVERPILDQSVLQSYVGAYTADDPQRHDQLLSVHLEDETLVLNGATMRYGTLVPVSPTRFHLQATPVNIEFQVAAGLAQRLTLITSDGTAHGYRRT